jgi:hypothetical protein
MTKDQAVAFMSEAARYFERLPDNGEDATFWSNATNAANCRKIAAMLMGGCIVCGRPESTEDCERDDCGLMVEKFRSR